MSFVRTSCPARLYCTESESSQPGSFMRFQPRQNFTMDDLANVNPKPLQDERELIARNCTNSPILVVDRTSAGACSVGDSRDVDVRFNGLPVSVDDETAGDLTTLRLLGKDLVGQQTDTPLFVSSSDLREHDRVKAPEVDFLENCSAVDPGIRLQEQYNKVDLDHGQLVDELNRTEHERNELLVRLIQFVKENAALQDSLQETRSVESELREQTRTMNAHIGKLEEKLASLERELDRSREISESLQREKDSRAWKPITSSDPCTICGNSSTDLKRMRVVSQIVRNQQQDLERMHTVVHRQRSMIEQLVKRLNIDDCRLLQLEQKDVVFSAAATSSPRSSRKLPVSGDELRFAVETTPVQVRDNVDLPPNKLAASKSGPLEFVHPTELHQPSAAVVKPVNKNSKLLHPGERKSSISVESIRTPPTMYAAASNDAYAPVPRSSSALNARQIQSTVASSVQQQQQPGSSVKVRMQYPPTNCCPICQAPMPVDISSPDFFARHVDDCLQRVTKEVPLAVGDSSPVRHKPTPPPGAAVLDGVGGARNNLVTRVCPICNANFPTSVPYETFERHVDEHFPKSTDEFELLP